MRKLRLIKVVVPRLMSFETFSSGEKIPSYCCPECHLVSFKAHNYCSECGSAFDWSKAEDVGAITAKDFVKLGEYLHKGIQEGLDDRFKR